MSKRFIIGTIMIMILCISIYVKIVQSNLLPLNEDEIAQGYNTYSVLLTGRDEFGNLPIRYLSFGENKLPLTGLLSLPAIGIGGLQKWTIRLPLWIIGVITPFILYMMLRAWGVTWWGALWGLIIAATTQWWIQMTGHQHEAPIVVLTVLLYLWIYRSMHSKYKEMFLCICMFAGLYTYHSAKIVMPLLWLTTIGIWWYKGREVSKLVFCGLFAIGIFGFSEWLAPNNRVSSLSYFTSNTFTHEIEEGRRLGGSSIVYNKLVYGVFQLAKRSFTYVRPDFYWNHADDNRRFAPQPASLITLYVYTTAMIGITWSLYKKREEGVWALMLVCAAILPAAASSSLVTSTRSLVLVIPLWWMSVKGVERLTLYVQYPLARKGVLFLLCVCQLFASHRAWAYYEYIYRNDTDAHHAWSGGMEEVAQYAWQKYDSYQRIYISPRYGQGYIYMLLYGGPYDPKKFQKLSKNTTRDMYGFFTQKELGHIRFETPTVLQKQQLAIVHRDEKSSGIFAHMTPVAVIRYRGIEAFYVYEGSDMGLALHTL